MSQGRARIDKPHRPAPAHLHRHTRTPTVAHAQRQSHMPILIKSLRILVTYAVCQEYNCKTQSVVTGMMPNPSLWPIGMPAVTQCANMQLVTNFPS